MRLLLFQPDIPPPIDILKKNSGGHTHSHSAAHHIRTSPEFFSQIKLQEASVCLFVCAIGMPGAIPYLSRTYRTTKDSRPQYSNRLSNARSEREATWKNEYVCEVYRGMHGGR